jgi:glycogenin glucosyltransferase
MSKHAYVTLMTGGDAYLPGVEALGQSLVATGTKVPRVVMVTPDVSFVARAVLEREGWIIRSVEPIPAPADELLFKRFALSYVKLRVFQLLEYEKIVFVDADAIVIQNIDELFERPFFAAAPDFFMPDRFNSGVMVLDPSEAVFGELLASLGTLPSYDGGDQGVLNAHWPGWWTMPPKHRLPAAYNFHHFIYEFMQVHEGLKRAFLHEIKVVHFTVQKPWQSFTLTGGSKVWWENFYLAHPEKKSKLRDELHRMQDGVFDKFVGMIE